MALQVTDQNVETRKIVADVLEELCSTDYTISATKSRLKEINLRPMLLIDELMFPYRGIEPKLDYTLLQDRQLVVELSQMIKQAVKIRLLELNQKC